MSACVPVVAGCLAHNIKWSLTTLEKMGMKPLFTHVHAHAHNTYTVNWQSKTYLGVAHITVLTPTNMQ